MAPLFKELLIIICFFNPRDHPFVLGSSNPNEYVKPKRGQKEGYTGKALFLDYARSKTRINTVLNSQATLHIRAQTLLCMLALPIVSNWLPLISAFSIQEGWRTFDTITTACCICTNTAHICMFPPSHVHEVQREPYLIQATGFWGMPQLWQTDRNRGFLFLIAPAHLLTHTVR